MNNAAMRVQSAVFLLVSV